VAQQIRRPVEYRMTARLVVKPTRAGAKMRGAVRRERVDEVRRWLDNYQRLKEDIESIRELNHDLLRPTSSKRERKAPSQEP